MVADSQDNYMYYITRNISKLKIIAVSQGASSEKSKDNFSTEDADTHLLLLPLLYPSQELSMKADQGTMLKDTEIVFVSLLTVLYFKQHIDCHI